MVDFIGKEGREGGITNLKRCLSATKKIDSVDVYARSAGFNPNPKDVMTSPIMGMAPSGLTSSNSLTIHPLVLSLESSLVIVSDPE